MSQSDDLTAHFKMLKGLGATIVTSPRQSSADLCRERGWVAGTRLVGDEGYGPTVIEITAVGESRVLAKTISHNGVHRPTDDDSENSWTLHNRDWQEVVL